MRTTPEAPIDMRAEFPELTPFARTAVRLHPRPGAPTAAQSSMGGPLLWPAGEPWPFCDGPDGGDHWDGPVEPAAPLVPVLQLFRDDVPELPFPDGADILQVLWCPFDHEPYGSPRPQLRWRRRAEIAEVRAAPRPDAESDPRLVPDPCVLHPERVTEYPSDDLPGPVWLAIEQKCARLAAETGWQYESDLAVASGTKAGGYPGWAQSPEWPVCACGAGMRHLATIASWEFSRGDEKRWIPVEDRAAMDGWGFDADAGHPWRAVQNPAGLMLGDVGGVYLFVCVDCPDRPFDYRFDCA